MAVGYVMNSECGWHRSWESRSSDLL